MVMGVSTHGALHRVDPGVRVPDPASPLGRSLGRSARGHRCAALLLIFAWLAATAWLRPLALPDEGRYASVAWEMLRSGQWLVPTLNGLPYFHKPPLFYWITAAGLWAGGMNEWSARLAPILGATAAAFSLYLFLLRRAGVGSARASLLVLLTQPIFFVGAQFANLDMLVAGCITGTTLAAADASMSLLAGRPYRQALAIAYIGAALGVLAKGLIGAALPALVLLAWLTAMGQWRLLARLVWLPGLALFLTLAAPWFVAMQLRYPSFLDYFFLVQQFERYTQGGFNNVQPFWFFPAVLAVMALPWTPWLLRAGSARYLRGASQSPVSLLMWCWLAVIVLFFSLPRSKLVGYALPALAPLAFLVVDAATGLRSGSRRGRRMWAGTAVAALLVCLAVVAGIDVAARESRRGLGQALGALRHPGEPVIFLREYFHDIPFYARLRQPVLVVDDWTPAHATAADNWRKELWDASGFGPNHTLIGEGELLQVLCASPASWVLVSTATAGQYAFLAAAQPVASTPSTRLYRIAQQRASGPATTDCDRPDPA
jgi:4-amino-4-deoxy-L-arabinose transferase-like glycosyltransferase